MCLEILDETPFKLLKNGSGLTINVLKAWMDIIKLNNDVLNCNRRGIARDIDGTYYFVAWNNELKEKNQNKLKTIQQKDKDYDNDKYKKEIDVLEGL